MVIAGSLFIVGFFVAGIVLLVKKKVTTGQFCAICAVAIIGGIITGNVDSIRSLVFSWGQGGSLSVELQQKVDLMEDTIKIADEGMRMRIGLRSGLDGLLSIAETSPNEEMRIRAKNYFEKIASDYESYHQEEGIDHIGMVGIDRTKSGETLVDEIVGAIRTEMDLNELAHAFLALREVTGVNFKMFDLAGVEQWCKQNKPVCESGPH